MSGPAVKTQDDPDRRQDWKHAVEDRRIALRKGIVLACRVEVAVDVVEQLGSTSFLYGTTASGEPIVAEQRLGHARSDGHVTLRFRPADARLFGGDGMRIR